MNPSSGRTALVTGGGTGIGRAIALRLEVVLRAVGAQGLGDGQPLRFDAAADAARDTDVGQVRGEAVADVDARVADADGRPEVGRDRIRSQRR